MSEAAWPETRLALWSHATTLWCHTSPVVPSKTSSEEATQASSGCDAFQGTPVQRHLLLAGSPSLPSSDSHGYKSTCQKRHGQKTV